MHTLITQVDVLFPSSLIFLWTDPDSLQYMLKPILEYSNNDTKKYGLYIPYNLSWAPHTLGKWPSALKQKLSYHIDKHS